MIIDLLSSVTSFKQSSYKNFRDMISKGILKSTPAIYFLAFITPKESIIITFLPLLFNCFAKYIMQKDIYV